MTLADVPDPADGALKITVGTAALLGAAKAPVDLTFTIGSDGTVDLLVAATMAAKWTFTDSFSRLDQFPFDVLDLADVCFFFSSAEIKNWVWPAGSGAGTKMDLAAGLSLTGMATFDDTTLIGTILGTLIGKGTRYPFAGPFSPTPGQVLPVGRLAAKISDDGFSIGTSPNNLQLAQPTIVVSIDTATDDHPIQEIDLAIEAIFNDVLTIALLLPIAGNTVTLDATPLPSSPAVAALIEKLPGGSDFMNYLPSEVSAFFEEVGLDRFEMVIDTPTSVSFLGFDITTLQPWKVIDGILTLDQISLSIDVIDPGDTGEWIRIELDAQANFLPKIFLNQLFDFTVIVEKQTSWVLIEIAGAFHGSVSLGDIIAGMLGDATSAPDDLLGINFSNFGVTVDRPSASEPYNYMLFGEATAAFPIAGQQLAAVLSIAINKTQDDCTLQLIGGLVIGEEAFSIKLDLGTAGAQLSASWTQADTPLGFGDIAAAFGWDSMPPIPEDLDLDLSQADFSYDFHSKAIAFSATSTHGQITFLSFISSPQGAEPDTRIYLFGLDLILGVSFSDLPVIGSDIPSSLNLGVDQLQLLIANQSLSSQDMEQAATLLQGVQGKPLLAPVLGVGATFAVEFLIEGVSHPLVLPLSSGTHDHWQEGRSAVSNGGAPPYTGNPIWFNLGKTLGPVSFDRIGVQYSNSTLLVLVDASLSFTTLSLTCQGLGIGSPLTHFSPQFHLDGLALSFSNGPVSIAGGLQIEHVAIDGQDTVEYNGEALITAADWSIAALGSWSSGADGTHSLFVFAFLDDQLGGSPPFFITGLSAGFGYNRSLTQPAQDEVQSFPLVAGLTDPSVIGGANADPATALAALGKYVSPASGSYWAAAGVQFTSFEIVHSNALAIVDFGNQFEIVVLGLSRIKLPQTGAQTYAYVELGLEVIVDPGDGTFSATAFITPNSFVIDPACHLTGGFAFFTWFGDNLHAGDFVLTVGGYHPLFAKPGWYPSEPRLGFSWQVSDQVTIQGEAYFALTPSCVMGGGELDVQFHSGDLAAWFTAHGDFLIQWKPFHFVASVGVSIGVSYRVHLLFVTTTISVELGADLQLWGPPTGGNVDIHLWIVSFSVSFGPSDGGANDLLQWNDFCALLPQDSKPGGTANARALYAPPTLPTLDNVCKVTVNRGLLALQPLPDTWVVRSDEFQFTVETAFPLTELDLTGPSPDLKTELQPPTLNPPDPLAPSGARADGYYVGLRSMGITCTDSTLTLEVSDDAGEALDLNTTWVWELKTRSVAEAMWGQPIASGTTPLPAANLLPARLVGLTRISPKIIPPTGPDAIPKANLSYLPVNPTDETYLPFPQTPATQQPTQSSTSRDIIASTIASASAPAPANRAAIFAALGQLGYDAGVNGDLSALAANISLCYPSSPMLGSPVDA